MKVVIGAVLLFCLSMNLFAAEAIMLNDYLTIYGETRTGSNGRYTLSGNVNINHLVFFDDDVVVELHESQTSKITTDSKIYFRDESGSVHYLKKYIKSKTFKAVDNQLVIDGTHFTLADQVGGFNVFCEQMTFDEAGNYLDVGYVPDFPGIVKDVLKYALNNSGGVGDAGSVDLGIQYFKDGSSDVRCNVENLVYASPIVLVYDFDLTFNPGENVFGGGFKIKIPALNKLKSNKTNSDPESRKTKEIFTTLFGNTYSFTNSEDEQIFSEMATQGSAGKFINGIIVDMRFVQGAIESFTLGILTDIPIGATGTLLTQMKGSAWGVSSDKLKLSATVNIGTALDPMITLEDLGVTIKKGYISGGGKIKIFKKTISSGKIYYSKKKKAFKVSGRLNLGGVLKGKVKASLRKSKFSGSSRLSVNTPEIDVWAWKWLGDKNLGYAEASIHKNTRFRAKLKYKDVKLAIQTKYISSYPYFKFYIGTNYDDLHRIAKRGENGSQTYRFDVDENVRDLILVAGNDTELFDFTATDPEGAIYNNLNTRYTQIDSTKQTTMYIQNPKPGAWTFQTDESGEISFNAMQINQPPTFMFHLPSEKRTNVPQLSLSCSDYQDTVSVEFYYDTDNRNYDGTLINSFELVNNATVDFYWDNADIDNGEYYIYAVVDDGKNAPIMQYAPGSILVNNWDVSAPENITVTQTADSALVSWTPVDNPDIASTQIYVRNASSGEITEFTSTSDSVYITDLVSGYRYEIWAAFQNEDYLNSFSSERVSYTHLNHSNGNNIPYFTISPEKIFTFQSGEHSAYTLTAYDADGDLLTYDIIDMPAGMALSGNALSWTPTEEDQGVYNLKFKVSDGVAMDSVYHEVVVYNKEQAEISIQYSSLNLYKDDNLYLIVNDLHNSLPTINCSWRNPFTNEDIGVELKKVNEFTYIGKIDLPEFPTSIFGQPVNFEDYPIVATYNPPVRNNKIFSVNETYTTSGIYNVNTQSKDEISPAAINDITITNLDKNRLLLTWTATGDDANTGKAFRYDLRYNYSGITTESAFNSSYTYESEPYPQVAGLMDSIIVNLASLTEARNHDRIFFSLKAIDECGNTSGLSNNPSSDYLLEAADVQYTLQEDYSVRLNWDGPAQNRNSKELLSKNNSDVIFLGYNIYRTRDNKDTKLIHSGVMDNTWYDSLKGEPDGSYYWTVESVYNTGVAEKEYSDTLRLDRFNSVSIVCRLETAEDYRQVEVNLAGLDTIYSQQLTALTDSTGLAEFSGVFDGQYQMTLQKSGFNSVTDTIWVNNNSTEFSYYLTTFTGLEEPALLPTTTRLYQNYPNPFNPSTEIKYYLPNAEKVSIIIYDLLGRKIRTLVSGQTMIGENAIKWDGANETGNQASSGIYIFRLKTKDKLLSKKMLLLR